MSMVRRLGLLGLALAATPAFGLNVGYYDMSGSGASTQVPPIVAAGHTPVLLQDLTAADLAGIDIIVVQNGSNDDYGSEYPSRLSAIAAAVAVGKVLVLHDRRVVEAATKLPGGAGINFTRLTEANIDVVPPGGTALTNGPGGLINDVNLDNGSSSHHGFATLASLPAGAVALLRTNVNATQIVAFAYPYGSGVVYYSTIPLDYYLAGSGSSVPAFKNIYAPNVIAYAVQRRCTGGDCDGDGVFGTDNCPYIQNPTQADGDADGVGDVCDRCPAFADPAQPDADTDGDGDGCDNCPTVANSDQADADTDGTGDACEDVDGDGRFDPVDNCPTVANADQADGDGDHVGTVCDNCPLVANQNQADSDHDGFGDACADRDHDGRLDGNDNCPDVANVNQADGDFDGIGTVCDNCPTRANHAQTDDDHNGVGDACEDHDGDGIFDTDDNCPAVPNPNQADADHDHQGDVCDDRDGDGVLDADDNCPGSANGAQVDSDADTRGDECDRCPGVDDRIDGDGDGAPDACDNCPGVSNPNQSDFDTDGAGDACDDSDGDGTPDATDNCRDLPNTGQGDRDYDGLGDLCDDCTDPDDDGFGSPGFPENTCALDNCPLDFNPTQLDGDGDGTGDACMLCQLLRPLTRFSVAARNKWSEKESGRGQYSSEFVGSVCAVRAVAGSIDVQLDADDEGGHMIALKNRGNAIKFVKVRNQDLTRQVSRVSGDVVTGGGTVKGPFVFDTWDPGVVDTSGTHPAVAECRAALDGMIAASDALAALPPTRILGDVQLRRVRSYENYYTYPGSLEMELDPGEVVQIDSLTTEGWPFRGNNDSRECDQAFGMPTIYISGGPAVINLGDLQLGNCAEIEIDGDIVFNLPGTGRTVSLGLGVYGYTILAPYRTIKTTGSDTDHFTEAAYLWGKNVLTTGATILQGAWAGLYCPTDY